MLTKTLNQNELREFYERMCIEMMHMLKHCCLPIFALDQDQTAQQCGTGTLFRIAESSFLVTATHVVDLNLQYGFTLYLPSGKKDVPAIDLYGDIWRELQDGLDVAVWRLPNDRVTQLDSYKFLTIHQCDPAPFEPRKGFYLIHGFPTSMSVPGKLKCEANHFTIGTYPYVGDARSLDNFDPKFHFLMDSSKDEGEVLGPNAIFPNSLRGISGSAIWRICEDGCKASKWATTEAKIIGIQTSTYKDHAITKGTQWWVVYRIIYDNMRELRPALKLLMPT